MRRYRLKFWLGYWWCLVVGHDHEPYDTSSPYLDAREFSLRCLRCGLIWPRVLTITYTLMAARAETQGGRFGLFNVQKLLEQEILRHKHDRKAPPEAYEAMFEEDE